MERKEPRVKGHDLDCNCRTCNRCDWLAEWIENQEGYDEYLEEKNKEEKK